MPKPFNVAVTVTVSDLKLVNDDTKSKGGNRTELLKALIEPLYTALADGSAAEKTRELKDWEICSDAVRKSLQVPIPNELRMKLTLAAAQLKISMSAFVGRWLCSYLESLKQEEVSRAA